MAEFHFYGTTQDCSEVLDGLFALGLRVIPNLSYEHPAAREFTQRNNELEKAITVNRRLFVAGPYSGRPPFFVQLPSGRHAGAYEIDITRGGPLMALSLPGSKIQAGRFRLTPGHLFYPRLYWDDEITVSASPSQELREYYGRLKNLIKGATVSHKPLGRIRVGKDALRLLEDEAAEILVDGKWLSRTSGSGATGAPG